jgi:hypothetical protein
LTLSLQVVLLGFFVGRAILTATFFTAVAFDCAARTGVWQEPAIVQSYSAREIEFQMCRLVQETKHVSTFSGGVATHWTVES